MEKNSKKKHWGIVDFDLVDQGVPHLAAMLYEYIVRFEQNKKVVYASIPYIAKNLRLSERTTQRYIRQLLSLGLLYETTQGRTRYLQTTPAKLSPIHAKLTSDPCQNGVNDPCQNGMLSIKDLSIENINISKSIFKPISNSKGNSKGVDLESEFRDPEYLEFKKRLLANKAESPKCNLDELPD